jgi:subtilisin family serine protease
VFLILSTGCGSGGGGSDTAAGAVCAPTQTASIDSNPQISAQSFSPGQSRFIVKFRSDRLRSNSLPMHAKAEVENAGDDWQVFEAKDDPAALLQELMDRGDVAAIEPDYLIYSNSAVPNDPGYSRQWAHGKVDSLKAWDLSRGSSSVVVAVVDGGVETTHPDLAANIWHNPREVINGRDDDGNGFVDDVTGWDFISNDNNPKADAMSHIHGTHVAGIIGAVGGNGKGISGHAPGVKLMPLKYIGADGTGYTSNAIRAIDYAVKNGASVINASWSSSAYSQALYDAIARARAAGVLVVAASGNDSVNIDKVGRYPAAFTLDNIVSVAASTGTDGFASFSDYGLKNVDIAAPGTSIYSTRTGGSYATIGGTSMATPLVSAVAALIKARHPSFNYRKIATALFTGVDKISSMKSKIRFGGRLNAYKALLASDDLASGRAVVSDGLLCP